MLASLAKSLQNKKSKSKPKKSWTRKENKEKQKLKRFKQIFGCVSNKIICFVCRSSRERIKCMVRLVAEKKREKETRKKQFVDNLIE